MDSTPDLEMAFNKAATCDICGDSNFMCECKMDIPDYDTYDDNEYED